MEFIKKFNNREYVFHSENDANFADKLWRASYLNYDNFENLLEENNIEFEYDY